MVLDHSMSQSSENSHSGIQTVEGGRCVYERRHGGYEAKLDTAVAMSASCSPSQATEYDDSIQRNSKDID